MEEWEDVESSARLQERCPFLRGAQETRPLSQETHAPLSQETHARFFGGERGMQRIARYTRGRAAAGEKMFRSNPAAKNAAYLF